MGSSPITPTKIRFRHYGGSGFFVGAVGARGREKTAAHRLKSRAAMPSTGSFHGEPKASLVG